MKFPLRVRLTLLFVVGIAVVLTGFSAFVYVRVGRDLLASVDLSLAAQAQSAATELRRGALPAPPPTGRLVDPDESFAQILDAQGHVVEASSQLTRRPLLSPETLAAIRTPTYLVRLVPAIDVDPVRLLAMPLVSANEQLHLVVGATLGDRRDALHRLLLTLSVGGPIVLILVSAAGWAVIGGALRPVERMRLEAAAVSASEPDRRLPVPRTGDELARLGATLNAMLDRLQQAMSRERRFVDDASHELRTPLSVLKMELDLALARARTAEELEAAVRNASAETDRLVRLAEDLLVLARMDGGRIPVTRKSVPAAALVHESAASWAERARGQGARMHLEVEPETVSVDPARVRQAIENLLDNSVRVTPEGGVIALRARRLGNALEISVTDSGPGFPQDRVGAAFEPFARANPRDGNQTGTGLGLAIVRAVAEAHGGTVAVENLSGGGARVTVLLDRAIIA